LPAVPASGFARATRETAAARIIVRHILAAKDS
jgi:hypothetical protein